MTTNDGFLFQRLHEGVLEFVRAEVATLSIGTDLQRVGEFRQDCALRAVDSPEGFVVDCRRATSLFVRCVRLDRLGLVNYGCTHGLVHFAVNRRLTFETVDLMTERDDVRFHLVVGCGVLSRNGALGVAVRIEKRLRGVPCFCALLAQFENLGHTDTSMV